ncbi:hypothetical protein HMPREF3038_00522 [Akkermansia sp. KLE1797]|nr:hypothetical protein HMPREF3038_00522 [Akkermansia sp. KLE1797]KXU55355.1 hypothetical protein HMPREF3039_00461 [Akkermansia sp. KLE1798]
MPEESSCKSVNFSFLILQKKNKENGSCGMEIVHIKHFSVNRL